MQVEQEWNQRYEEGNIPWDMTRANPILSEHVAEDPALGASRPGRALVPGCGRGWDAAALAGAGWKVTALDIATAAVAHADNLLEPLGGKAVVGDALAWEGAADLLFDHTFFCALEPEVRPRFGELARRVVVEGGLVVSIVFPIRRSFRSHTPTTGPDRSHGPPYDMVPEDVSEVLGGGFRVIEMEDPRKLGSRSRPHRWTTWRQT